MSDWKSELPDLQAWCGLVCALGKWVRVRVTNPYSWRSLSRMKNIISFAPVTIPSSDVKVHWTHPLYTSTSLQQDVSWCLAIPERWFRAARFHSQRSQISSMSCHRMMHLIQTHKVSGRDTRALMCLQCKAVHVRNCQEGRSGSRTRLSRRSEFASRFKKNKTKKTCLNLTKATWTFVHQDMRYRARAFARCSEMLKRMLTVVCLLCIMGRLSTTHKDKGYLACPGKLRGAHKTLIGPTVAIWLNINICHVISLHLCRLKLQVNALKKSLTSPTSRIEPINNLTATQI